MAQRYKERLLQSSGVSNKKFESEIGMKLMKKMGWSEGKGLGKKESGITDCVQIKRREDGLGLGQQHRNEFSWNDNWWDTAFNSAIKKLEVKTAVKEKTVTTSSSEESDEEEATKRKVPPIKKKIKKQRKESSSESSESSDEER